MMKNPYEPNDVYDVATFTNKEAWRNYRQKGIGGSDAASALGMSKWMSNVRLWEIKKGKAEQDDISNVPAVIYGTLAEDPLRQLWKLENEDQYELFYKPDTIMINREEPMMRYSPDAMLIEKETGRLGIWECKTATVNRYQTELWKSELPKEYYIQILHGMNVTGADFVELHAQINHFGWYERKTFHIERNEVMDDLEVVMKGVKEFIGYIERDEEPPLWIN